MIEQPILRTPRLILRPYMLADAPAVERLVGAFEVADTTLSIPHPYETGMAEEWIGRRADELAAESSVSYAVTRSEDGQLLGGIGLDDISSHHNRAELGYWIGVPFWSQGYATEAALATLAYAFDQLKLNRVVAGHFTRNPASGRVMQKAGMKYEGTLRQHLRRWDKYEDAATYAMLASEWRETRREAMPHP